MWVQFEWSTARQRVEDMAAGEKVTRKCGQLTRHIFSGG